VKDKEYWDFSWAEMGLYDDVANIDFIKEKTGEEKIFYIGYSEGTVQMFYGLSHIEESYFEKNLIKFIALAPCSVSTCGGSPDLEYFEKNWFRLQDLGVYAIAGPNWDHDL